MSSLLKIIYSIGITVTISTLFAFIFKNNFWYIFTLATLIQIVGFIIFNQIYANNLAQKIEAIKIDQLKEANRNLVEITCPCDDNAKQIVDFRFDVKNIFKCEKCGKNFTALVDFKTVLTTDPIYFDN